MDYADELANGHHVVVDTEELVTVRRVRKAVIVSPRPSENANQKDKDTWPLRKLHAVTDKVIDAMEKRVARSAPRVGTNGPTKKTS